MSNDRDLKWKHILLRVVLEFLLDKLPELITMLLNDLGLGHEEPSNGRDEKGGHK